LTKLARNAPYYRRNSPHLCSFYVKGTCTRGLECPYRHDAPLEASDLNNQNIKDRYYGKNDPVAKKMLNAAAERAPVPPADKNVTTLWVGGVIEDVTEEDIKDAFYSFGELKFLTIMRAQNCAFVTFTTREAAEAALNKLHRSLFIKGNELKVAWGRGQQTLAGAPVRANNLGAGNPLFGLPPPPPPPIDVAILPLNPAKYYPSMNPHQFGSKPDSAEHDESSSSTT